MAKTISQSISSIESSDSSLSATLTNCKNSISKKGVSVPSTTRFSGLPALIDKIQQETNTKDLKLKIPSGSTSTIYLLLQNGTKVEDTGSSSNTWYTFSDLVRNELYNIRYKDSRLTSLDDEGYLISDDHTTLMPNLYIFISDQIEKVSSVKIYHYGKEYDAVSLTRGKHFWYTQVFRSGCNYFKANYADSSTQTAEGSLFEESWPHVYIVYLDIKNKDYYQYSFESLMTGCRTHYSGSSF